MLRLWERVRPGSERPARSAIALGLVFAVVVGLGTYWDYQRSTDGPREKATVVARHKVGPSTCPGSGRGNWDPKQDVTWRSANPPDGLPAEFLEERVCDSNEVGDTVEIIRVIEDDRVKVYENVPHSGREALEMALWTFVLVFLIVLPIMWLRLGLTSTWRRVRTR